MLRMPTDTYLWSSKQNLLENYWVYPPPPKKKQANKETKNKPKTHFSLTSLLSQNRTVIDMYRGRTGISMNVVQFGFHYLTV